VVTRSGESDLMTLKAETASPSEALRDELAASLRAVTKLGGNVDLVGEGSLPNDGKAISTSADSLPNRFGSASDDNSLVSRICRSK